MVKAQKRSGFAVALGSVLRRLRGARTFQEVADATGGYVHPRMVQNYEEGTEPKLSTFLVLCAALGHRPAEVLPKTVTAASEARDALRLAKTLAGF